MDKYEIAKITEEGNDPKSNTHHFAERIRTRRRSDRIPARRSTRCKTAVSQHDPNRTISDGSRRRNRPRPQRCSRRHLLRRLSYRPNPSRLRNRGPRQKPLGLLGGTRMDGHVRPSRILESQSSRRGMHQSTRRPLRPAVCVQTHRIAARRPFQARSHRRNQTRNRQKRLARPGARNGQLHDVEGFVSHRLRRPQRTPHDVLRNSETRCSLGRKSHKLPSPRRKLLVHPRRSLPTTQILPTTVRLPGRSSQMVRWNAGTEHVKTQRQTLSPAGPKIEIHSFIFSWRIRRKLFCPCISSLSLAETGWPTAREKPIALGPQTAPNS